MTLFTCRGRQIGAHPLAPGEPYSALQANQPERLPTNGLAAPSHARVVITYRSNSASHPILCARPLPDVPAGCVWPNELGGPRRRKWGAIDSDFLTEGEGGARLAIRRPIAAIARLGRVPSWPRTGHEASKGPSLGGAATPALGITRDRQIDRDTLKKVP